MQFETFLKTLISLIWILQVSPRIIDSDDEFAPKTQRPIIYYPQSRIVGGNNAYRNQFPHQVSIHGNGILCGGSIISKNYVVTAAHCVTSGGNKYQASSITIRAGTTQINSGGIVVGVSEVKPHPQYGNFNYDIAVLKLSKSLEFNDSIKSIALATQNPPAKSGVVVSGWGGIYTGGPLPQVLQYNTLEALSLEECKRRLSPLPSMVICLGHTSGNGICGGDSGGPAVYNNQLVGVSNYNVNGCGSNIPDGFASVAFLNKWLKDNTDL